MFGCAEAAVVSYLRSLFEPVPQRYHSGRSPDDLFPSLSSNQVGSAGHEYVRLVEIEHVREAATLSMLAAVAIAAGRAMRWSLLNRLGSLAGGVIVILTFTLELRNVTAGGIPHTFNWSLFFLGDDRSGVFPSCSFECRQQGLKPPVQEKRKAVSGLCRNESGSPSLAWSDSDLGRGGAYRNSRDSASHPVAQYPN
jgi:hypothetical protein